MKEIVHWVTAAIALVAAGSSLAQGFPNKPIRIIFGFQPGTIQDAVARPVALEMEKRLGQPIILEFKPGANGTIAAKFVAGSAPDGYTLNYNSITIHPIFNKNNAVDAAKELAPVSQFVQTPVFLFARTSLPVTTLQELVAYGKANPNNIKYGTSNPTINLGFEMLKVRTGLAALDVPYKASSPTILAMLASEVDMTFSSPGVFLPHVEAGKLRAIFVASNKRSPILPNVPSASEIGIPNFELAVNNNLWAPVGTPRDVVTKLSEAAAAALRMPTIVDFIRKGIGSEPVGSTPEEQLRTFESEVKFWSEAARLANYQPQ